VLLINHGQVLGCSLTSIKPVWFVALIAHDEASYLVVMSELGVLYGRM